MTPHGGPMAAVRGGAPISAQEYASFLAEEYLAWYLPAGGGSVKFAVTGDAEVADRFEGFLRAATEQQRCVLVSVSAETTKVHLIEQVFFAVARDIDWNEIAAAIVASAYDAIDVPAAAGRLSVAEVAADQEVNPPELYRSIRRQLERSLLADPALPRELRRALLRLAHKQLASGDVSADEAGLVLGWLTGEPVGLRELRDEMIYTRIGRHNARSMLTSVGRLLLQAGYGGLVLHIDLARLAESRRPPIPERDGIYYAKAAVLDAYELLRQLIDSTDELAGTLVVAVVPPELVIDEQRGLPSYSALQLRVMDEVRDRRRANPFASLVRLDVRLEAVR